MAFLVLLLFSFNSFAVPLGKGLCFAGQADAEVQANAWNVYATFLGVKLRQAGKKTELTEVRVGNMCDNCLVITGDPYIKGVIEEQYKEIEKDIPKPGEVDLKGYRVDVSIGGLDPYTEIPNGKKIRNPLYVPFLRFPILKSNTFYDADKNPIEVSAKIVHPEIIEYTFKSGAKTHSLYTRIGESIRCMYPAEKMNRNYFILENGKYHPIYGPSIKSFIRDFTYPGEAQE